jgi:periplasmic divalent cation tolerance protein
LSPPRTGWLYAFALSLVADGVAATAHNFTPVRSIYTWQGQVHERTEGRVSLHTRRERVADIVARAKREHPCRVRGVSARPIIDGNPDYLAWIAAQTDPAIPA